VGIFNDEHDRQRGRRQFVNDGREHLIWISAR